MLMRSWTPKNGINTMSDSVESYFNDTFHQTCNLSDLKQICKIRGFSNPLSKGTKADYADYVQLRFLNEIGLQNAFSQCDEQELKVLHFLKLSGKHVNIEELCPFFIPHDRSYYMDAHYKETLELVKTRLICKGLVLVKEGSTYYSKSKWHRYVVFFPSEISKHLPPITIPTTPLKELPTHFSSWASFMGESLLNTILKNTLASHFKEINIPKFQLAEGLLKFENKLHPTTEEVYQALLERWFHCETDDKSYSKTYESKERISFCAKARKYLLQNIPKGHGIQKEDLSKWCEHLHCPFKENELNSFIESGILLGFLGKCRLNGIEFFVPNLESSLEASPAIPLTLTEVKGKVMLNLSKNYSLHDFLTIARISLFELEKGELFVRPCLKHIGKNFTDLNAIPFIKFLQTSAVLYRQAFQTVKESTGKLKIHSGLKILKLNSIDIKSLFVSTFSDEMIDLGNDYYAVSEEDLAKILQFGKKKGYIPKIINSNEKNSS